MARDLTSIPEFARPWAKRCLAGAADMSDDDIRNVGDWLAALAIERPHLVESPGRLVRMNWAQAMEAQRKWHDAIAAKTARLIAEKKGFGGAPDDVELVLELEGGFRWVRILSPDGLDYEGAAMGHCVGGGHYDRGRTILSLRDADNLPHCTVEWSEDERTVEQVQGRANQEVVERYHPMMRGLVDYLQPNEIRNPASFGHLFISVNGAPKRLMTWRDLCEGDRIDGYLDLYRCSALTQLPDGLTVTRGFHLEGCTKLTHLPNVLKICGDINLVGCTALAELPDNMRVRSNLRVRNCTSLTHLPDGLKVDGDLTLFGCTALTHLPVGLRVNGTLNLRNCTGLTHLPHGLTVTDCLDLEGCTALTDVPWHMYVRETVRLPNGQRVSSVYQARDWFAERFPAEIPSPCLT